MSTPVRLNKVLKELNISLDRAVEFLSSKKIDVEPRPTSKIDQETYGLLLAEFQTDKSDKDKLEEINTQKKKELEEKQIIGTILPLSLPMLGHFGIQIHWFKGTYMHLTGAARHALHAIRHTDLALSFRSLA